MLSMYEYGYNIFKITSVICNIYMRVYYTADENMLYLVKYIIQVTSTYLTRRRKHPWWSKWLGFAVQSSTTLLEMKNTKL